MLLYQANSLPDWKWFEDVLTYDNAVLPHALFVAGMNFGEKYLQAAEETCQFLLENIFNGSHFSFIGCKGGYKRGGKRAEFDQQPINAASTVMMLRAAYDATKDRNYLTMQRKAFDWFLGENDLRIPLYDFRTKGCNDGLMREGVNINQGAESALSFMLSLLSIVESYAIVDKLIAATDQPHKFNIEGQKKNTLIKSISAKTTSRKKQTKI